MRAAVIEAYGGPENIQIIDLATPEPQAGEVQIAIKAAGVNAVDTYFRDGYLGDGTFPLVMGSDFAGIVSKVGDNVTDLAVGDEVYGYKYLGNGTYAEYATVAVELVGKKPAGISFEEAAALPCTGLIAYDTVVNILKIQPGETLLVTGASGGVGMFAVQIAKAQGAHVIATASTEHLDFLRQIGADTVIDYTAGDYVAAVRAAYPGGVDAALPTASRTVASVIQTIRDNGRLTWITGPDGPQLERGITGGFTNGSRGRALLDGISGLIDAGKLPVIHIDKLYTLEEAAQAQIDATSGTVRGKLVIVI